MTHLEGRTILVTGGSRGIGAAIVEALAQDGARVVIHYGRDKAKAEQLLTRVLEQRQNQRGKKVYSLHAPEVECIGKSLPSGLTRGARPMRPTSSE